jgi:hypothetical protein
LSDTRARRNQGQDEISAAGVTSAPVSPERVHDSRRVGI